MSPERDRHDPHDNPHPGPRPEADPVTNADAGLTGAEGAPPEPRDESGEEDRDEAIDEKPGR
jgi:hypothetical protein